jgi:2-oxoglutarate ferredoxin oxidoreductase subunit delta
MENRLSEKFKKIYTGHVWANTQNCKACWECINACREQVIGKVSFLWHKHVVFKNSGNCIGCKKCVQICQYGVFSENLPDIFKDVLKKLGINDK